MEQASAPSPDAPDARERILRAATELIASDGIDEVRIARVANRARASTALVHHYFSTREELLAQALLQSFELAADERFVAGPAAAGSASEGLAIAIDECLPTPGEGEREWILWVELWLRAAREPELRPVAGRMYESYREWVARVIRRGVENGEFSVVDPDEVADLAMALFDGLGVRALIRDPAMSLERARRIAAERLAAELGIDPEALAGASSG
ncbi:MAG: TetR family transcriptional regulator C-terminal domain-containing protein [Solirubrobacterales bacterium]